MESDAEDLLQCYSDLAAVKIMNSDYCTNDFHYKTIDEMRDCIRFWLELYSNKAFVRFSVIDKQLQKAVGTIEIFGGDESGVLRIDLQSNYEKQNYISELLKISNEHFYNDFQAQYIITKAIPEATKRISALLENGFMTDNKYRPNKDYYVR